MPCHFLPIKNKQIPANEELDFDLSPTFSTRKVINEVPVVYLEADFVENMDQIRKTMMQHEALFKEQVQALHKLYDIQKVAMQEIRRRSYSQAQVLAFSPESLVLVEGQFCGSVLEGKPLRPVYTAGRAHKQDALALSLSPFCTLKEIKGSGSLWIDGVGAETFPPAHSKPVRNFDLEKLPEDAGEYTDIQGIAKQWKGNNFPDSTESFQDLGKSGKIVSTSTKSDGMVSSPKDPVTCSQDSSILEPQHCESKELNDFNIQRSIYLETNSNLAPQNPNLSAAAKDSSNGSNSIESQETKFFEKKDTCVRRDDTGEAVQASPSSKAVFLSECEEEPHISQDVLRPSACSTHADSEIKTTDSNSHSNCEPGNVTNLETPPVVTEGNQNRKGKPVLYEECESLAAEILLSFAPSDTKRHAMEAEPGKSYGDPATSEEKRNMCQKRCGNFSNGDRVYESLSWTRSANSLRTVKRHR
ncbi:unnamed protein product [Dovyalis caffra]|uniref:Uncharacterized protein n=1 Tax=Dovyalis caffra TaxID=77055 RepID=A0AAV1SPA6_9ROSI|nr:unnamed protein product [Dovyalis caffra]